MRVNRLKIMLSARLRYIIGFGIGLLILGLLFIGILRFIGGGDANEANQPVNEGELVLIDYANTPNSVVSYMVDGEINSEEEHRSIMINVSKDSRTLNVYQGYTGNVIITKSYSNNETAYRQFLYALERSGMDQKKDNPDLENEQGVCPEGNRFTFELEEGGQQIYRAWASSCSRTGNLEGAVSVLVDLFQKQIPDYNELTQDVALD